MTEHQNPARIPAGTRGIVIDTVSSPPSISIDGIELGHIVRGAVVTIAPDSRPRVVLEMVKLAPSLTALADLDVDVRPLIQEAVSSRLGLFLGSRPVASVLAEFKGGTLPWDHMERQLRDLLRDGSWIFDLPK